MDNNLISSKGASQFQELPQSKLVTSASPQSALGLINANDFGAGVATAVAEPDKFHEAEIDLAGDALTQTEIAAILSKTAGLDIPPSSSPPRNRRSSSAHPARVR